MSHEIKIGDVVAFSLDDSLCKAYGARTGTVMSVDLGGASIKILDGNFPGAYARRPLDQLALA